MRRDDSRRGNYFSPKSPLLFHDINDTHTFSMMVLRSPEFREKKGAN
jgi:hypothetical protein